jgi:hypothetical protein
LPAGASIISATLTMRDVMGLNGDPSVGLHRMSADWGEGTSFQNGGMGAAATQNDATWLYRFFDPADSANSPAWTTPGGDFSATASASAIISDDNGGGQLFSWSTIASPSMLADLQGWLDDPSTNYGWAILGDESKGQTAKRLNSGESTTLPNIAPVLELEYVVVPEPTTLVLACGGAVMLWGSIRRARHAA